VSVARLGFDRNQLLAYSVFFVSILHHFTQVPLEPEKGDFTCILYHCFRSPLFKASFFIGCQSSLRKIRNSSRLFIIINHIYIYIHFIQFIHLIVSLI